MKREIVNWCSCHRSPFEACQSNCGYAIGYFDRIETIAKREVKRAEYDRKKYERLMAKKPPPICLHCNKEIKGHRRKFCDARCRTSSAKQKIQAEPKLGWIPKMKNCRRCGEEFMATHPAACLCGKECRWKPKKVVIERPMKECAECGSPTHWRKKFCSKACNRASDNRRNRKGKVIHATCHCCNKPTNHERKYCGKKCEKRAERQRFIIRKGPKPPPPIRDLICPICQRGFQTNSPSRLYCGHKCSLKKQRIKKRQYERGREKPLHTRIKDRLSGRLRELLRREGKQKTNAISKYMGCTPKEMLAHVERQLEGTDMNWGNYGVFGWHLDHIIPCTKFDLTNEDHVAVCFNWRNIRPLWGVDNYGRQDRVSLLDALEIPKELFEMAEKLGIKLWV